MPTRQQWNLTLQHELLPQTVLTVAYTGSVGRHGVRTGEPNAQVPTAIINGKKFWEAGLTRRNTAFARVLTHTTDANSNYNSLQVSVNRRFTAGLQFQGAYTWGHSIDDGSQQWGRKDATISRIPRIFTIASWIVGAPFTTSVTTSLSMAAMTFPLEAP